MGVTVDAVQVGREAELQAESCFTGSMESCKWPKGVVWNAGSLSVQEDEWAWNDAEQNLAWNEADYMTDHGGYAAAAGGRQKLNRRLGG